MPLEINTFQSIRIRQAGLHDLPVLHELYTETIRTVCAGDYDQAQLNAWKLSVTNESRWVNAVREQFFLVAEADENIVGFGSLKDGYYIDFMYSHKNYQSLGIAGKLLGELELEAKRQGKNELVSDVSKTACSFFEKRGFVVEKENLNIVRGVEIINYRMKKNLYTVPVSEK